MKSVLLDEECINLENVDCRDLEASSPSAVASLAVAAALMRSLGLKNISVKFCRFVGTRADSPY